MYVYIYIYSIAIKKFYHSFLFQVAGQFSSIEMTAEVRCWILLLLFLAQAEELIVAPETGEVC